MRIGVKYTAKTPSDVTQNGVNIEEGFTCWAPQSLVRTLIEQPGFEPDGNGPPKKPKKKKAQEPEDDE